MSPGLDHFVPLPNAAILVNFPFLFSIINLALLIGLLRTGCCSLSPKWVTEALSLQDSGKGSGSKPRVRAETRNQPIRSRLAACQHVEPSDDPANVSASFEGWRGPNRTEPLHGKNACTYTSHTDT